MIAKKFNLQKAVSGAKTVYNKSHGGFKKANAIAKILDNRAAFLNKHVNTVNKYASTHKDKCVHKATRMLRKGTTTFKKRVKGFNLE